MFDIRISYAESPDNTYKNTIAYGHNFALFDLTYWRPIGIIGKMTVLVTAIGTILIYNIHTMIQTSHFCMLRLRGS